MGKMVCAYPTKKTEAYLDGVKSVSMHRKNQPAVGN